MIDWAELGLEGGLATLCCLGQKRRKQEKVLPLVTRKA